MKERTTTSTRKHPSPTFIQAAAQIFASKGPSVTFGTPAKVAARDVLDLAEALREEAERRYGFAWE